MARRHVFGVGVRGIVAIGAAVGLIALAGCSCSADPPAKPEATAPAPPVETAARVPPVGFGVTYRKVQVGVSVDEKLIKIEAGLALGKFGVTPPVLTISTEDGTIAFLPDFDPKLSVELNNFRTITVSADGTIGRELGVKYPVMKGRLVYDLKTDMPYADRLSGSAQGHLKYEKGMWAFTPSPLSPLSPTSTNHSLKVPPTKRPTLSTTPHVIGLLGDGPLMPAKGYTWLDGTTTLRPRGSKDLAVKWHPGESSLLPAHVHASVAVGKWVPDPGYVWTDGTAIPVTTAESILKSVRWEPGRASSQKPGLVAGSTEGKWLPAPGYVWATTDPNDLSVRPADQP